MCDPRRHIYLHTSNVCKYLEWTYIYMYMYGIVPAMLSVRPAEYTKQHRCGLDFQPATGFEARHYPSEAVWQH